MVLWALAVFVEFRNAIEAEQSISKIKSIDTEVLTTFFLFIHFFTYHFPLIGHGWVDNV
jgi:hypothetical protein